MGLPGTEKLRPGPGRKSGTCPGLGASAGSGPRTTYGTEIPLELGGLHFNILIFGVIVREGLNIYDT
jgi:hypothetical protein